MAQYIMSFFIFIYDTVILKDIYLKGLFIRKQLDKNLFWAFSQNGFTKLSGSLCLSGATLAQPGNRIL